MLRVQFSIITIASSTTNPTEIVRAISDRLSRLKPESHISANVPASDRGTVIPGRRGRDAARRRKTKTTIMTSERARPSVSSSSSTLAWIMVVRSFTTERLDAGRNERGQLGQERADAPDRLDDVGLRLSSAP